MKGWQKGLMRRTKATRGRMGSIFADFMHADRVARCPVFDRTVRFFGDLSGQEYDAKPDN